MEAMKAGRPLWGLELRYVLTITLRDHGGALALVELVHELARGGYVVAGRPSKTVSDALRWEVRKGRVVRIRRGLYGPGHMPRSTEWWIRKRIAVMQGAAVAPTLAERVG